MIYMPSHSDEDEESSEGESDSPDVSDSASGCISSTRRTHSKGIRVGVEVEDGVQGVEGVEVVARDDVEELKLKIDSA